MPTEHAIYQIGLKILLEKDGFFLFLQDAQTGLLDFPGGRMNSDEHGKPLKNIVEREVQEELGPDIQYQLGAPLFQYRRYIPNTETHIFITVYSATYISGSITLSEEHAKQEWKHLQDLNFQESDFGNAEEFTAIQNYFDTSRS